ncbi:HNH endonuclease family protein [Vibrio alginolyticus]
MVGNILPLCAEINGDIADKDPKEKLSYYSKSELILVKEFVDEVNSDDFDLDNWNEEQIKTRTESIAKLAYELV